MFTPQEVQDKKFPKAVFGGYDMGEVDDFLDSVSEYYAALYKENVVLKNKLKILAEKIEEYRSVDTAMRKALLSAQKMANEITEEAKKKCEELQNKAQIDYENSMAALKDNIRNEEKRLEKLREETSRFAEASILIYNRQIETIKRMLTEPSVEKIDAVKEAVKDIEKNFSRELIQEDQIKPTDRGHTTVNTDNTTDNDTVKQQHEEKVVEEVVASSEKDSTPYEGVRVDTGYNSYDLSDLFPTERGLSKVKDRKESQEAKEVNVGGVNVRVFEMDLTDDKRKDITP